MVLLYSSKCSPGHYTIVVSFSICNSHMIISSLRCNKNNLFLVLHVLNSLDLSSKATYPLVTAVCIYIQLLTEHLTFSRCPYVSGDLIYCNNLVYFSLTCSGLLRIYKMKYLNQTTYFF